MIDEAAMGALLGKTAIGVGGIVAGIAGGWFTSRASMLGAVNKRVESLMAHLELEITRLTTAHLSCEERVEKLVLRIEQVEGELRQAKQTVQSIAAVSKP